MMATLGRGFLLMGVICRVLITLPTVGNGNRKVSVTFFSKTFTTTDSVSTEELIKKLIHISVSNKEKVSLELQFYLEVQ